MSPDARKVPVEVEGRTLLLSNLDKVLYPEAGFTKADVIAYYSRIAPVMLAHLRDRPLTLKRYPNAHFDAARCSFGRFSSNTALRTNYPTAGPAVLRPRSTSPLPMVCSRAFLAPSSHPAHSIP